ncbi:hypothetical protein ACS0TY_028020 [Phlomoides rotata]
MDGIASNSFQMKMDRGNHHRVAQVDDNDAMKTMMMTLMEKFDAFSFSSPRETLPPLVQVQEQQVVQEVNFMGRPNYNQGRLPYQSQWEFQQGFPTQQVQGIKFSTRKSFVFHSKFQESRELLICQPKGGGSVSTGIQPGCQTS